jgi:hypothetical protein
MTSDSQRTSYLSAVKDRNTANAEFDEGFEPKPIDLSKLSDPTGSGEGLSLRQIFIGDETTPEPAGMLGDYIAFNNLEGASPDNRANAVMLSEAARTHMALKGDVAQASASILQAPQMPGTAMDEKIAFNAVSNMLWVDSTNPMTQTYQAFPMPNNPGLVRVGFATDPPTTVIMPAATYEQLDTWRSIIQSEMMNGKYNDAIAAQTTKNEEDAAGAAQQAEVEALPEKLPSYFGPIYPTE